MRIKMAPSSPANTPHTILLNKVDLASPDRRNATRSRIDYLCLPGSRVVETDHCKLDPEVILHRRSIYFPASLDAGYHDHHEEFRSFSLETEKVASLERLDAFLENIPPQVVRAKGIVRTDQGTKLLQLTLSGCEIADWEGETDRSRFAFIGKDLRPEALEERLSRIFLT